MKDYIDTLGTNDPELRTHGNLDSIKQALRDDLGQSLRQQAYDREHTFMEFKPGGIVFTITAGHTDSAKYTIEENSIKIDEAALKGHGETMTFDILVLSKDTLKLRVVDYGDTSLITMVPVNQ